MLAIIPARKGSKRLPNKNIMPLLGKPLIQYTLYAANYANCIDRTIISTDITDITGMKLDGEYTLLMRQKKLCGDDIPIIMVIKHILNWVEERPRAVILLQPTSPLRTSHDIDEAAELSGNVLSVCEVCPNIYKRNGAIYIMRTEDIMENNVQFNSLYVMPKEKSIDIDTKEDFEEAERLMRERNRL